MIYSNRKRQARNKYRTKQPELKGSKSNNTLTLSFCVMLTYLRL